MAKGPTNKIKSGLVKVPRKLKNKKYLTSFLIKDKMLSKSIRWTNKTENPNKDAQVKLNKKCIK